MQITASSNADVLAGKIGAGIARQLPFAAASALTATALDIRVAERAEMQRVFDRPTPFTLNAFEVVPATKESQTAKVRQKATVNGRHYLQVEVMGGPRPQTGVERLLDQGLGFEGVLQAILPADNARLDAYGNWSTAQRNQVLSALRAQRDPSANETTLSRIRGRRRAGYFVPRAGLTPGVYRRDAQGNIGIVLAFTAKVPTYERRFDFYGIGERTFAARYPVQFAERYARALATAR